MINKDLLMGFFKDDDIKVVDKDFYIKSQMKSDVIKYITILEEENERLNNIIDELEKDLIDYFKKEYADRKLENCNLENCAYDYALVMLGKLKELKEGK